MTTDQLPVGQVRAAVADIRRGFIVAYPLEDYGELTKDRSITFKPSQWQGDERDLYRGVIVDLYSVTLSARGWRAREARPVTPSIIKDDTATPTSATRNKENPNVRFPR